MPNSYRSNDNVQTNYDPRWFIWTIVFLVSTGIALTGYIMYSDHGTNEVPLLPKHITKNQ